MKTLPILALLLATTTHAQERTVGGPLDTQASWAALQNQIEATNGNVATLRVDVDAMKTCNNQKKIHAPTAQGADADGCVSIQPHMHWNEIKSISTDQYGRYSTSPAVITSAAPACGRPPQQMDFCPTLHKKCYTQTPYRKNCTNRGSGTGCNGNPTRGSVSLWMCM